MRLHRSILCTKEGTPLPLDSLAPMRRRAHQASALLSSPRPSGSKPLSPASPGSGRERIREGECGLTETTSEGGPHGHVFLARASIHPTGGRQSGRGGNRPGRPPGGRRQRGREGVLEQPKNLSREKPFPPPVLSYARTRQGAVKVRRRIEAREPGGRAGGRGHSAGNRLEEWGGG